MGSYHSRKDPCGNILYLLTTGVHPLIIKIKIYAKNEERERKIASGKTFQNMSNLTSNDTYKFISKQIKPMLVVIDTSISNIA